ncbi:MAPEG family protein [Pelomonas sp. SE-A7]|uniref:MAPEG family protein n=1 Tax=Pelomonas sp. SE-A7 TaxID=3054953 RepID=UPI00259C8259|nr:MAPEG family protein [Pelomonas sp. SE-A7]MDM4768507.1 MAPEG family protein [Pelomonas sp. SE-A7]
MTPLLKLVLCMACITWLLLLLASLIKAKGWTPAGFLLALGNRDNMPDPGVFAGRADRTAKNTLEAFVLFTAIALVAHVSGVQSPQILLGAQVFFWSRIAYIALYYLGVAYVRTAVWIAGNVGLVMIIMALR